MEYLDKAILGAMATILVAFVSGVVSVLVASQQTKRELRSENLRRNREVNLSKIDVNNAQVSGFVEHALNEDLGLRLRLAEYLSIVTPPEDQRKRWQKYRESLLLQVEREVKGVNETSWPNA